MSTFRFQPSARLQRFLGQELIADPNLAIVEFVKNAYDAGAEHVFVHFQLAEGDPQRLVIADDGTGMDEESFERNWMHPGYSQKAADAPSGHRISTTTTRGRTPVGEKGLGRLAAGRLGNRLEVYTRRRKRDLWLYVDFRWNQFDDMTKSMDQIRIPYTYVSSADPELVPTGTIIVISGLQQTWDGRVRGRPVPGRSRTRLGRLKQDLRLLVRPLAAGEEPFTVHLDSDSFLDPDDIGTINLESSTEDADYIYDFSFSQGARDHVTIRRELTRSDRLVKEFGGKRRERLTAVRLEDVPDRERRPHTLECGPFSGRFIYTPPPAARRALEVDAVGHGVLLYRDGLLVEPYGLDGDDWVGVSSRKAQRQGYALVQPTTFSGYVLISRNANPQLRDMSNRQGLIENEPSEVFLQHVRSEFLVFEETVFEELSKRWTSREERAARESEESLDLAAVRLRAVAHSLGQPLLGLGADIAGVRLVAKRNDVPDDARQSLLSLADSAERHLAQARGVVSEFRNVPPAERTAVPISRLLTRAVDAVAPLAGSLGVQLQLADIPSKEVFVHEELVLEALKELIRNAVEAPRDEPDGFVQIGCREVQGDYIVDIVDNATGISGGRKDQDLTSIRSTKGRPGEGLSTVSTILLASRGHVRIASTGDEGTHMEVYLPTRIGGLKTRP